MEAVRDNVKSKTILDMDLSRYKRRPVPKAFHLTAKPSRDTLEQQKLTRLNRKLYGLYCYDSLGMLTFCKTNKVQSATNGAIGSFIKTLDLLQLFHHIILLMHVTLYLISAACLILDILCLIILIHLITFLLVILSIINLLRQMSE